MTMLPKMGSVSGFKPQLCIFAGIYELNMLKMYDIDAANEIFE